MKAAFSIVSGLMALALFCLLFQRFARISWGTAKAPYVAMYLLKMLWCVGVMWSAWEMDAHIYQPIGVGGILCWVFVTRHNWRCGAVPEAVLSTPMPLDSRPQLARRFGDPRNVDFELDL